MIVAGVLLGWTLLLLPFVGGGYLGLVQAFRWLYRRQDAQTAWRQATARAAVAMLQAADLNPYEDLTDVADSATLEP